MKLRNRTIAAAYVLSSAVLAGLLATAIPAAADPHDHDASPVAQPAAIEPLARDCSESDLPPHDGFQSAEPRCVSTAFGEQSAQVDNPSLLIVKAPDRLRVGEAFTIRVSTQNLVRDRFLGAAAGGYYLESALLDDDGLTRGHFHTACRDIGRGNAALEPNRQAIFVATEDGGGGDDPDTVEVRLPGLPNRGTFQCAVWAGDGSHRTPMMAFANQIPAFDAVRIEVRNGGRR